MAKNADIRYIRFYTDGSAAKKLDPVAPARTKARTAKPRQQKPVAIHIDPVAVFGIVVSLVMLVCILVGMQALEDAQAGVARMEDRIEDLKNTNEELQTTYKDGYDLDVIRVTALEMGMVPASEVEHISIHIPQNDSSASDTPVSGVALADPLA